MSDLKFIKDYLSEQDGPEPGTKEYMMTPEDKEWEEVIEAWEEEQAKSLVKEYVNKYDEPDMVEAGSITWENIVDDVAGTQWDQVQVRDMADPHKDHKDSLIAFKHIDFPESAKEDIHRVEGVVGTPGTWVCLICGSFTGLNTILNWVKKQIKPHIS